VSPRARLAAVLAAVAAAACTSSSAPQAGAHLAEPSSVAVFRGVTIRSDLDPSGLSTPNPYRPYLAIANAASNDLSIVDGVDDTLITAPAVVRGLVYPVPGRPVILAAGDLGDLGPDLLVVVTAGDLPWLGGTQLQVIRTWAADGAIVDRTDGAPAVDFGADVLALLALPPDPAVPGAVKLVAALAGEQVATVTFKRVSGSTRIDVDAAQATVTRSGGLGFQPLSLAAIPGERTRVFAASTDQLPGGTFGVAQLDVTGTPFLAAELNAHAPTRLVAAGRLAEVAGLSPDTTAAAFAGSPAVDRVFAVLDESLRACPELGPGARCASCGFDAAIPCGLVALDPDPLKRDLLPDLVDPALAGSMHGPFRAPIPVPFPLALGFSGPPVRAVDPQYAGSYQRVASGSLTWQTTGVLAVASADGYLTFVDAARWNVPSSQFISPSVTAKVASTRPSGTSGTQFLTLVDPHSGATVAHTDASGLTTSVTVTAGFTPTDRWTVTREGALPGLVTRRAESFGDGSLALQATSGGVAQEVVRLWDPTLGVTAGDIVVIEPTGLGTCTRFEATITGLLPPAPARPGGSVTLGHRTPTVVAWDRCVDLLAATSNVAQQGPGTLATIRAGGYVLLRGTGSGARHVGRPAMGQRFEVAWQDEAALTTGADRCALPPAVPWPGGGAACGDACRARCDALVRARLSRRIAYVNELPAGVTGPALAFTLGLAQPTGTVPRDLALVIDTFDGRAPFRLTVSAGYPVDPREALPFDRSPWAKDGGIRFLVPWAGGSVLDTTPSVSGGAPTTIH
jgi:hypothetical protein